MGYDSVDKLQNLLASEVFQYTNDKKKAAGRALGTFIELITYYVIKNWKLDQFISIERPLPEFANNEITHNVEFTLHGSKLIGRHKFTDQDLPLSCNKIIKNHFDEPTKLFSKKGMVIDKNRVLKNACTLSISKRSFINIYINTNSNSYEIYELTAKPFAMFECKRVGVEEGKKKGPQTIEKAKQGSYVARMVSSLQRIRYNDGSLGGIIQKNDGTFIVKEYYSLLNEIINSENFWMLNNFILTIGIISNHGNWFTSENQNKELKVLAQSYDWLVFLTDQGIGEFITDLLIKPQKENKYIKEAFDKSYNNNNNKKRNVFTKVKIDYYADIALTNYFKENETRIKSWFNVITPKNRNLDELKNELSILSNKNWWEIYQ
ncbi:MAG: hypothetical protein LBT09_03975 [Planctomycetaceae bacterium]|jgi:hypothetical protein|nr:hypothetical protein [Planctomycetaceae bacterium]